MLFSIDGKQATTVLTKENERICSLLGDEDAAIMRDFFHSIDEIGEQELRTMGVMGLFDGRPFVFPGAVTSAVTRFLPDCEGNGNEIFVGALLQRGAILHEGDWIWFQLQPWVRAYVDRDLARKLSKQDSDAWLEAEIAKLTQAVREAIPQYKQAALEAAGDQRDELEEALTWSDDLLSTAEEALFNLSVESVERAPFALRFTKLIEGLHDYEKSLLAKRLAYRTVVHALERRAKLQGRISKLLPLWLSGQPNEEQVKLLRRVSRLFLAGFDDECVLVCRTLLESACADALGYSTGGRPPGLQDMIDQLGATNRFNRLLRSLAHQVRIEGNRVAHSLAGRQADSLGVLEKTLQVLDVLHV